MIEQKEPAFLRIRFYTTLPAVLLLLSVLAYGTGELVHARLLHFGEEFWPGYHALRSDPTPPTCDVDALRQKRDATLRPAGAAAPAPDAPAGDGSDDLDDLLDDDDEPSTSPDDELDDLLDDDEPGDTRPAGSAPRRDAAPRRGDPPSGGVEDDLDALLDDDDEAPAVGDAPAADGGDELDDLLDDDEAPAVGDAPAADGGDELDDLLDDDEPAGSDGELDGLLGDEPGDVAPPGGEKPAEWFAWDASLDRCEAEHVAYRDAVDRITPAVKRYRVVESAAQWVVDTGIEHLSHALALLLLICAVATTAFRHHIALRPARGRLDYLVSDLAQLVANGLLLWSAWTFKGFDVDAFGNPQHELLHWIWIVGLGALCVTNLYNLATIPKGGPASKGILRALLSVPLYATMALIAGSYFLIRESHPAGLAIYLAKLTEHAILYLNVGLYVWVGMLLKRTKLANLCFDALRPWKLAPELLAFVAVVGAALPTAYSGASGIFVIAVGAVIYRELRRAGARRQLALAATAMSGSMGVVLSPCLLVVIVASLNQEVTTDQLYGWGFRVFLLSAALFLVVSLFNRQGPLTIASPREAMPGTFAALRQLLPYLLLFVGLLLAYRYSVDAGLDEHSAPVILPVLMIGVLLYDRMTGREVVGRSGRVVRFGFRRALGAATSETTGHIGALVMLMGLSICLGGIIERSEVMELVPQSFGSVWTSMGLLVIVLVVIGMIMDPYGAVVLVSATIASVAYRNGIDPVHFWMVVLVAFELGYLTPPVALNHLLTRQVVGDTRVERGEREGTSFWSRHERLLLPIVVMGISLIAVAFGPLLSEDYGADANSGPPAAAVEAPAPVNSSASP